MLKFDCKCTQNSKMKINVSDCLLICFFLQSYLFTKVDARLICQRRHDETIMGTTSIPITSSSMATISIPPTPTRIPTFVRPNLCCGMRPFNSQMGVCCLGKLINRAKTTCCLDGTAVPRESRCLCYPSSKWILVELDRMVELEQEFENLIEAFEFFKVQLQEEITIMEENVELLDAKASSLYQEFLREIDIIRNVDPGEVDYIINLVLFLNVNEENIENARKSLSILEDSVQEMLDDMFSSSDGESDGIANDASQENEGFNSETLIQLNREIQAFNTSVATADSLLDMTREEVDSVLTETDNKEYIESLILERNQVLMKVNEANRQLRVLKERRENVDQITAILEADKQLLSNMRDMLDGLLDQILSMEAAFREENPEVFKIDPTRGVLYEHDYTEVDESVDQTTEEEELSRKTRDADEEEDATDNEMLFRLLNLQPPPEQRPKMPKYPKPNSPSSRLDLEITETPGTTTEFKLVNNVSPNTVTTSTAATRWTSSPVSCNFTAWTLFINNFVRRAALVALDLQDIENMKNEDESFFGSSEETSVMLERASRTEEHFSKNGHGTSNKPVRKFVESRKKRNAHLAIDFYLSMNSDGIGDDETIRPKYRERKVHKNLSLTFLDDFKNFQLSDEFINNVTQFIRYHSIGYFDSL